MLCGYAVSDSVVEGIPRVRGYKIVGIHHLAFGEAVHLTKQRELTVVAVGWRGGGRAVEEDVFSLRSDEFERTSVFILKSPALRVS